METTVVSSPAERVGVGDRRGQGWGGGGGGEGGSLST